MCSRKAVILSCTLFASSSLQEKEQRIKATERAKQDALHQLRLRAQVPAWLHKLFVYHYVMHFSSFFSA